MILSKQTKFFFIFFLLAASSSSSSIWDIIFCISSWPQTSYLSEDDLELLIILPPPPKYWYCNVDFIVPDSHPAEITGLHCHSCISLLNHPFFEIDFKCCTICSLLLICMIWGLEKLYIIWEHWILFQSTGAWLLALLWWLTAFHNSRSRDSHTFWPPPELLTCSTQTYWTTLTQIKRNL